MSVVPRFAERQRAKGPVPDHEDRLQEKILQPFTGNWKDRLQGSIGKIVLSFVKGVNSIRFHTNKP